MHHAAMSTDAAGVILALVEAGADRGTVNSAGVRAADLLGSNASLWDATDRVYGRVYRSLLPDSGRAETPLSRRFRDCGECPEMIVVPPGSFTMGSPESEEGRDDDEGPRHRVTVGWPFAVGAYEVTFAEWDECVRDGGCGGHEPEDEGWGRGRRPVINVSWDDAVAYAEWLSEETGWTYRLLSEAEWNTWRGRGRRRRGTGGKANWDSVVMRMALIGPQKPKWRAQLCRRPGAAPLSRTVGFWG